MKTPNPGAAAVAAAVLIFGLSTDAQGQPSSGFRGGPAHWGGGGWRAPPRNVVVVRPPGAWWGPGPWRAGGWGHGAGWGPGVWAGGWWGPGVWAGGWSPGVWVAPVPQTVVVAPAAPVFIERAAAEPPAPAPQVWWYWCADARAYFPYVAECPGGWQRVAPQTVAPADRPQ